MTFSGPRPTGDKIAFFFLFFTPSRKFFNDIIIEREIGNLGRDDAAGKYAKTPAIPNSNGEALSFIPRGHWFIAGACN